MEPQEKFTKLVDEFVDECNLPIYSQAKGVEPDLIDETSVEDRFEVYKAKLQIALKNKKANCEKITIEPHQQSVVVLDKYSSPRTRENLLLKENYKNYKIYQTESHSSSKSELQDDDDAQINQSVEQPSENQEALESDNENNAEVKTLLQTSNQQIELINKMLVEQRQRKLHQLPQEDGHDEAVEYLSERLQQLASTARDRANHSLQTQCDESIERELWVSKSANGRFGQDCSVTSDCTRVPPSMFTVNRSEKPTTEFLDDEFKNSFNQRASSKKNQAYYHCRNKSLNEKSKTQKPAVVAKTSESATFEAGTLNRGQSAESAPQIYQKAQIPKNQIPRDKLSIEDRLRLEERAREARLDNLRKEREKSIESDLKDKPEISKNSQVILMNSERYKNQGDVYQRCLQFKYEKEINQKAKQYEKIAEDLSQCTYQPEINQQSRKMNRQIDSLFEWNNQRITKQNKMKEDKEQQALEEFESLQKKVLICEGTKKIIREKGSHSQEPVEVRLLSQGARFERKINEIRNQQFQCLKEAVPKIDKKSDQIIKAKAHTSFHQRLAKSMSANSCLAKSDFIYCDESEKPGVSSFDPVEDPEREQFLEGKGPSFILAHQPNSNRGSDGQVIKSGRRSEAQIIPRKIIEEKLMSSDILSDVCDKSVVENQPKHNQKPSNELVQGESFISCLQEQYEELGKLSNQVYGHKRSQHALLPRKQNTTYPSKKLKSGVEVLERKKASQQSKDPIKDQNDRVKATGNSAGLDTQPTVPKKPVSNYVKIIDSFQNIPKPEPKKSKPIEETCETEARKTNTSASNLKAHAHQDIQLQPTKKKIPVSQKPLKTKPTQSKPKVIKNKNDPVKENKYKFAMAKPQFREKETVPADPKKNQRGRELPPANFFSEVRQAPSEGIRSELSLDMKAAYISQRLNICTKDYEPIVLPESKSIESRTHSVDQSVPKASSTIFLNSLKLRQNKIFTRGKDDQLIILDKEDSLERTYNSIGFGEAQENDQNTQQTRKLKPADLELFAKRNEAWLSNRNAKIGAMVENKERSELDGCTFKPFIYTKEIDLNSILQKPQLQLPSEIRTSDHLYDQTNTFHHEPLQIIESNRSPTYLRNFAVKKLGLSNFATPKNSDRSAVETSAKENNNSSQQTMKKPILFSMSPMEQHNLNIIGLNQTNKINLR